MARHRPPPITEDCDEWDNVVYMSHIDNRWIREGEFPSEPPTDLTGPVDLKTVTKHRKKR